MKPKENELFIGAIEETLSVSERESFEKKLKEDPSFRDDFKTFKEVYKVMENRFSPERKQVLESIQQADASYNASHDATPSKGKVIRFKPWHYAVAASIVVAIGLFLFNGSNKPTYTDFATHDPISLTVRGTSQSTVKKAETAFNKGDYDEALRYFDTLSKTNPNRIDFQLYKAQALIERGKFKPADLLLKQISEGHSAYASKAKWWAALSKLKQKQYKEAKIILKNIDPNSAVYHKAQKLLNEL